MESENHGVLGLGRSSELTQFHPPLAQVAPRPVQPGPDTLSCLSAAQKMQWDDVRFLSLLHVQVGALPRAVCLNFGTEDPREQ